VAVSGEQRHVMWQDKSGFNQEVNYNLPLYIKLRCEQNEQMSIIRFE